MAQAPAFRRPWRKVTMTFEEFLALPEPERAEWVEGRLVTMPGVTREHAEITMYLIRLLSSFLDVHRVGTLLNDPFLMRLGADGPARAPDLLFVANENLDRLRDNYLHGPADMAVEIISPGSRSIDRSRKFYEYESAGIPEYWLIDPDRRVAEFYVLDEAGHYQLSPLSEGTFRSAALPGFWLKVDWLWERPPLAEVEAELGLR